MKTQPFPRPVPTTLPHLFNVTEAAALLRVSTKTIRRMIAAGTLPVSRVGRCVRIPETAIRALLARG